MPNLPFPVSRVPRASPEKLAGLSSRHKGREIVDFTKVVLSGLGSQSLLGSHRFSVILGKKNGSKGLRSL